jgi:hypothetical protein
MPSPEENPIRSELKERWLAALADAESVFSALAGEEPGCLYSPSRGGFVSPLGAPEDMVKHYRRLGGVIPRIAENYWFVPYEETSSSR